MRAPGRERTDLLDKRAGPGVDVEVSQIPSAPYESIGRRRRAADLFAATAQAAMGVRLLRPEGSTR